MEILGPWRRREGAGRKGGGERAVSSHTLVYPVPSADSLYGGLREARRVIS